MNITKVFITITIFMSIGMLTVEGKNTKKGV